MSFPHRTALFDKYEKEILKPIESTHRYLFICPSGIDAPKSHGESHIVTQGEGPDDGISAQGDRYIPLASTGLEDSEGNEIFEGHLIGESEVETIVFWGSYGWALSDGKIKQEGPNDFSFQFGMGDLKVQGHALTDPELAPDSFDVNDYFGLEV